MGEVKRDGETVRRVPLVTLAEVEGASFLRKVHGSSEPS